MNDTTILTEALSLISSPMRPDGTWNRDRRACQLLAEEALKKFGYYGKPTTKLIKEKTVFENIGTL